MSFSPIIRVRRLLDKMKSESSPRLKRFPSRTYSDELAEKPRIDTSSAYGQHPYLNKFAIMEQRSKSTKEEVIGSTMECQFHVLPSEAIMCIFSFLESTDLLQARLVTHEWNEFADDNLIWKNLCMFDWNVSALVGASDSWKETYFKLEDLFSDGVWEGFSKWIEPSGYDNEQKTTARLHFQKRKKTPIELSSKEPATSPAKIHRVDSKALSLDQSAATETNVGSPNAVSYASAPYHIDGSGITINCSSPSPFKIEGERTSVDSTGATFKWNKHFEKHTSVYTGKIDYATGSVSGQIIYHDGVTQWKGVFYYSKRNRNLYKYQVNA